MKTEEDEAFEDIERRQGGFHAKRQAAMDKINSEFDEEYIKYREAFPKGYTAPQPAQDGKCKYCVDGCVACDARVQPVQEPLHIVQSNGKHSPLLTHMMNKRTIPPKTAQEPVGMLHIERLDKWLDASLKERKQSEWVGLTDEDIDRIKLMTYEKETNADGEEQEAVNIDWLIKTAEHFCKEKNNG